MVGRIRRALQLSSSVPALLRERKAYFSLYGEDAILTALLHPGESGTYVDVGANHPVDGSNTYRLYLRGWSGLAVDPNPRFSALFKKRRPRDTHLTEGVATESGELTYFEYEHDTLNTLSAERAVELDELGFRRMGSQIVPCRPLRLMVEQHLAGRQIDVMSVDCEGLDLDVLRSLDLGVHRPTVVIVEDVDRYQGFRTGAGSGALDTYLRENGYLPVAQAGYSAIYVAQDWQRLFKLSAAFNEDRISQRYILA